MLQPDSSLLPQQRFYLTVPRSQHPGPRVCSSIHALQISMFMIEPIIQMEKWRHNGPVCPPLQSKGGPKSRGSPPPSEFDFTEFSPGQPDGDIGGGSCAEWGGSWVLRPSCRERGLKLGWPSSAGEEPSCLLCLVCAPNRADGWSHSSSYKQLRPPLLPPSPPVLSTTVPREMEMLVGVGETG